MVVPDMEDSRENLLLSCDYKYSARESAWPIAGWKTCQQS